MAMDQAVKKKVLKSFTYGMFVFSSKAGDEISAGSVTWVTQCSFQPPLVAVGLRLDGGPYHMVKDSGVFALHLVSRGDKTLASSFFRPVKVEDGRMNGYPFTLNDQYDVPILEDAPAYIVCKVREITDIGDHHLVIGEVVDAGMREEVEPMVLREAGWSYSG